MRSFLLLWIIFFISQCTSFLPICSILAEEGSMPAIKRGLEVEDGTEEFPPTEAKTCWRTPMDEERLRDTDSVDFELAVIYPDSAELVAIIDSIMDASHIPGLTACVIYDGEIIWNGAFGMANFEQDTEVTDSTLFVICSMSKPFTGTALMQLYEEGLLDLDDDINDYLSFEAVNPHHPDSAITFWSLLTHTSSISDNWTIMYPVTVPGDSPIPLGEFLEDYLTPGGEYYYPTNFSNQIPGTNLEYSNIGVALIGYLFDVIADSFPSYCQENIFEPLVMSETSWFLAGLDTSHIAMPYNWLSDHYEPIYHWGFPFYPAGQLRTSTLQLASFLTAFMQYGEFNGQRILDSTTVELMTTVHVPDPVEPQGLIWYRHNFPSGWAWTHTGSFWGAMGSMAFMREEKTGIVLLFNANPGTTARSALTSYLFEFARGYASIDEPIDPPKIPKSFRLSQNYPNPFNPSTTIEFDIPGTPGVKQPVSLIIYDIRGRRVKTLVDSNLEPGSHKIHWDNCNDRGQSVASGIYLYTLKNGDNMYTRKMVLLK